MKYIITTIVMGSPGFIEIDEVDYKRIKASIAYLFESLFIEENLDLVTENFQEYEAELLLMASHSLIFRDFDYFSMSIERNTVSRRIVNLLSACRMYLDQSIHHINNIYGENSDKSKLLEGEINSQYDHNFGYRAMEALRNYTQHRGFPIHSMVFSSELVDSENKEILYTVIPVIKISELAEDSKFKKSVIDEMRSIEGKDGVDIRPLVRNYIEGIGLIHEKLREAIRPDVEQWEDVVNRAIILYKNEFGSETSLAGLAIVAEDDDGRMIEKRTIFKEFVEKRKSLESRNRLFVNLHKRYASNEIRKKKSN